MNNLNDEIILHKNQQQFDDLINDYEDKNKYKFQFTSCDDCKNKIDGIFQEICGNCKRFYGCYFEKKEM